MYISGRFELKFEVIKNESHVLIIKAQENLRMDKGIKHLCMFEPLVILNLNVDVSINMEPETEENIILE